MTSSRIFYYDVLNVVSCVSVIALHCNGYVHQFDTADKWWWLHVLFEVAFYNSVPIFFMLSGATLIGYHKKYDTKTFFKKRFRKAFLPFLVFSAAFYAFAIFGTNHPADLNAGTILHNIFSGHIPFSDYWFFVPLFLMYLFMPFLSVMVTNLTNRQVLGLIVLIGGIQTIVLPFLLQIDVSWEMQPVWGLPIGNYVAYFLLGYYLSNTSFEKNNKILGLVILVAIVFMSLRYAGIFMSEARRPVLFSYCSLYGFVASSAIFMIVKRLCNNRGGENYTLPFQKEFWCLSHTAFRHILLLLLRHTRRQSIVFSIVPRSISYVCCRNLASPTV